MCARDQRQQHHLRLKSFHFWASECSAIDYSHRVVAMLRSAPLMLRPLLDVQGNTLRPSGSVFYHRRTRFRRRQMVSSRGRGRFQRLETTSPWGDNVSGAGKYVLRRYLRQSDNFINEVMVRSVASQPEARYPSGRSPAAW